MPPTVGMWYNLIQVRISLPYSHIISRTRTGSRRHFTRYRTTNIAMPVHRSGTTAVAIMVVEEATVGRSA